MNDLVISKVIPGFIKSLFLSVVGMALGSLYLNDITSIMISFVALLLLIIVLIVRAISMKKKDENSSYGIRVPMWFTYLFTFLMGIGIAPSLKYYVSSMGSNLVILCSGITVLIFVTLFAYIKTSKRDFSFLKFFLFIALLVIIIFSIANVFLNLKIVSILLSIAGILIFSGYILYDVSRMCTKPFTEEDVPAAILDLYLDFINLLLNILELVNDLK